MRLVLVDLDNTLIDESYRLPISMSDLRAVAHDLRLRDIQIGLCSDSAVITLRQWTEQLGLTGPIVAERGAVIWEPERQEEFILDAAETAWFSNFRDDFVAAASMRLRPSDIVLGDATRYVKEVRLEPGFS